MPIVNGNEVKVVTWKYSRFIAILFRLKKYNSGPCTDRVYISYILVTGG